MVNFHDPAVILQNDCAYAFSQYILMPVENNDPFLLDRDSSEALASLQWDLSASLRPLSTCNATQSSIPGGSFLPTSTSNGRLFGAVAPTVGRYGYGMTSASLSLFFLTQEARTDLLDR
jgi:hypothetical protein